MKLWIIEINQNLKPADLNHWKETINFHISYADFAKELTDLFYLFTIIIIDQLIDHHSKNQKPKQIWKLFLLPPWKYFFNRKTENFKSKNRSYDEIIDNEKDFYKVKWSEVTPIFKEGKHVTVLT